MAADCSYFCSSTAFTTVRAPYCSADRSADRSIFRSSMAFTTVRTLYYSADHSADHLIFRSSTAYTTVCPPYCSADGSALLILPLVKGFHDGLRAVLLTGWQRIAPSSARQRLFRRFTRRNAQRITRRIAQSSARRIARRMGLQLIRGFTHFLRFSMTTQTFYVL